MPPRFNIGDTIIYTNPQGVVWGERKIVGTEPEFTEKRAAKGEIRYFIEPTDTPWYSVGGECLSPLRE